MGSREQYDELTREIEILENEMDRARRASEHKLQASLRLAIVKLMERRGERPWKTKTVTP